MLSIPRVDHASSLSSRPFPEARARGPHLDANRLALDLGVPSGRITDILNARRAISADTAVRLGRYFGNSTQFWLDLQGQYEIALIRAPRSPGG